MPSALKIAANRRNAARSTGPRTDRGKARSRLNALKHGMHAASVVARGEDPRAFRALRLAMRERVGAADAVEAALADRMAVALWRLMRVPAAEVKMLGGAYDEPWERDRPPDKGKSVWSLMSHLLPKDNPLDRLGRYESRVARSPKRALDALRALRREKALENGSPDQVRGRPEGVDLGSIGPAPAPEKTEKYAAEQRVDEAAAMASFGPKKGAGGPSPGPGLGVGNEPDGAAPVPAPSPFADAPGPGNLERSREGRREPPRLLRFPGRRGGTGGGTAMDDDIPLSGTCDRRFEGVRRAFAGNFRGRGEHGAAVAVTLDGAPVVDLWGGFADAARTRPWQEDTLVCMMSVAKGVVALSAHVLADRGLIDLDAPVARYWPAFAANGKDRLPVRYLLDHRAGLAAIDAPLPAGAIYDWDAMAAALAEQRPLFTPGSDRADQSVTMGFLVGEVVRRVTGKTPGRFLRDEIAGPLGLDYHIGLAKADHGRCAEFITAFEGSFFDAPDPSSLRARALAQLPPTVFNDPDFRSAEIPAINGHGTARAVARLYGALAAGGGLDGVRLLTPAALARATAEQWRGSERLLGRERRMALGFALNLASFTPMGPNPRSFGHAGAGGAMGFADPDARIGFAYAPNRMHAGLDVSPRLAALVDATFATL